MKRKHVEELFIHDEEEQKICDADYEYEDDVVDDDFADSETEADFDYDGERLHRYDEYTGKITVEIALVKFERLVRSLAKKYEGGGAEYEELFQIGQIELARLVEKEQNHVYLANYLMRRLARHISYHAARIRKEENRQHKVGLEAAENVVATSGDDWHSRETAMFLKVEKLLDAEEMKLVCVIYAGYTQREVGEMFGVSHTAIQKRLGKIREKLAPLLPWLREKRNESCAVSNENAAF